MQHCDLRSYGPDCGACLHPVVPVTREDLYRVHDRAFVDGVFAGTELNGFENYDTRVPEACLWTIGSLLAASRWAMQYPDIPACSPTSGFHHATQNEASGYCTFNGLMVVAAKLMAENPRLKAGILDCDQHFGDGTENILQHDPLLAKRIIHRTAGKYFLGDDAETEALEFQAWLHHSIAEINAFGCDLVLYQAGADPHVNDPMGGFLDDKQLAQRDRNVFCAIEAPVAWVLAGGYQRSKTGDILEDPVLRIHYETLRASDQSVMTRKGRAKRASKRQK
jgi:acetoin utilization deacetylase AcuC-like enzyme